jgi:hypothetical protein
MRGNAMRFVQSVFRQRHLAHWRRLFASRGCILFHDTRVMRHALTKRDAQNPRHSMSYRSKNRTPTTTPLRLVGTAGILLGVACGGSLYTVSDDGKGIPFYGTEQYTVVTDTYKEDIHELAVKRQRLDDDRKTVIHEVLQVVYTGDPQCAASLIAAFAAGERSQDSYKRWERAVGATSCVGKTSATPPPQKTWAQIETLAKDQNRDWIARRTEQRTRLLTKARYINVDKAAVGTTSGTIKLNEKGQLTEATASSENKTADAVISGAGKLLDVASGQLPFKELLLDKWGVQSADMLALQSDLGPLIATENVRAQLKYTYRPRLYAIECETAQPCNPPLGFAMSDVQPSETKASSDDEKVEFSGSIKLPEPKSNK